MLSKVEALKIENLELMIKLHLYIVILASILLLCSAESSFAQSSYVLPYPPPMPGSLLYKIRLISEQIQKYWYFGDFGQFHYNLKQSDKYLVEAKTLFEYKQYLLGSRALKKSDTYFINTIPNLIKAKIENKNITQKQKLLKESSFSHIQVLKKAQQDVPETFVWQPEKSSPTILNLKRSIEDSILIRNKTITHFFKATTSEESLRPPPR